jgi:hypothetical protein
MTPTVAAAARLDEDHRWASRPAVGTNANLPSAFFQEQPYMLRELARREGTSVDAVLARELEDVASAHAEELAGVPGLSIAMRWPESGVTG